MSRDLETKLQNVIDEASSLSSLAGRIAIVASELQAHGGKLDIHTHLLSVRSSVDRLLKDWAIVDYKQQAGARVRPQRRTVA